MPSLTLQYDAGQVVPPLRPRRDDSATVNDITVQRTDGGEHQEVDTDGPRGVDTVGRYDRSAELNVEDDDQLPDIAAWWLHWGTWLERRHTPVHVDIRALSRHGGSLVDDALDLAPGDRIVVENPPEWATAEAIDQTVLGFDESISMQRWTFDHHTTPSGPLAVFVLGEWTLGRLDQPGSELALGVGAADTELTVAVPSGRALWTTDDADFPFTAVLGGELLHVSAISGDTSPQTWTVVRALNGVSRDWPAGTRLRLSRVPANRLLGVELPTVVKFESDGTFTKANFPGLKVAKVTVIGGGGGGGGAAGGSDTGQGACGGGGETAISWIPADDLGDTETVTVGSGGNGGAGGNNNGDSGAASTFTRTTGANVSGSGGSGGSGSGNTGGSTTHFGGSGGSGGSGDLLLAGADGSNARIQGGSHTTEGTGGSSTMGGGARYSSSDASAGGGGRSPEGGYGGGGSGGRAGSSDQAGGDGAPGVVILELFGVDD